MKADTKKKVDRALKLLESVARTNTDIELAYSGGKDSDVILELARMAGIPFTPIYKNTTIDPPGTINHVRENGVQIVQPKRPFFKLVEAKGFPSRFFRFCCSEIKEYKIKDTVILGIRKEESSKRAATYKKPVMCRIYHDKDHVNQVLPILDWTLNDVAEFVIARGIQLAPHYYQNGSWNDPDFTCRLGCLGCPLASDNGVGDFVKYPRLVRSWIKAGSIWWNTHPNISTRRRYESIYEYFALRTFYQTKMLQNRNSESLFKTDWKQTLEDYFKIDLTI